MRRVDSGKEQDTVAVSMRQIPDELRFSFSQFFDVHEAPVALIDRKGFLRSNRMRQIMVPDERFQLRVVRRNNGGRLLGHNHYIIAPPRSELKFGCSVSAGQLLLEEKKDMLTY